MPLGLWLRAKEAQRHVFRAVYYQQMLEESFVLQDFKTFRHAPHFLENPRLFSFYPQFAGRVMEEVFTFGEGPKAKLSDTVRKHLSFGEAWRIARDLWGGLKI